MPCTASGSEEVVIEKAPVPGRVLKVLFCDLAVKPVIDEMAR